MATLSDWLAWFTGHGRYMDLTHCMGGDAPWIALTIVLDLAVAAGYVVIARHWAQNEELLGDSPAKSALRSIKVVFIVCGICGYLFIPIKMFWPAWRLYDLALMILVYYTWRYAMGAQHLRVVYTQLDQTEHLKLELEKSREEARRKSLFLSAVSHDVRTPLNGMSLQAELAQLCHDTGDAEGLRQSLAEIRKCARSAADLLGEFLELGRIDWSGESILREPIALDAAIGRLLEAAAPQAGRKGLRLESEVAPGLTATTDRRMLGRILQNLVENGIKYTPSGSIRVVASSSDGVVAIDVIDTGVGIAEEHQALVFQDFFQVDNRERDRTKGFGLGLSIAARFAAQLGGELRLESRPGLGSRFTLLLPGDPAGRGGDPDGRLRSPRGRQPEPTASLAR